MGCLNMPCENVPSSFGIKLSWQQFWESQQNSPCWELCFRYKDETYILQHDCSYNNEKRPLWFIAKYDIGVCGCEEYDVVLGKVFEEMLDCFDYDKADKWKDYIDTCYKLLNLPLFDGKSFREIIDDVEFEY